MGREPACRLCAGNQENFTKYLINKLLIRHEFQLSLHGAGEMGQWLEPLLLFA